MFLRSLVDFDRLTADEIAARLFALWFGPGFVALLLRFIVLPSGYLWASEAATFLGIALTGVVVLRDARHARLARPWVWGLVTAFIPLIGWALYGRQRAPDVVTREPAYRGRPSPFARYLNPFWQVRRDLVTHLSPAECVERLDRLRLHLMSPRQWFGRQQDRPIQGSVSSRSFAVRWRHAMTRPGLLTEASGRFEPRAGTTVIHLRLGQSIGDRLWIFLWFAVALIVGLPPVISNAPGAPPGFHQFWLTGWVGIFS